MKTNIKNLAVFVCVCTVITLLLAVTNSFTAPIIQQNENAAANQALLEVMPQGTGFETVSLDEYKLPATVTEVYKETSGLGYVMKLVTSGYGTGMTIMCGVDTNGAVTGAVCISSNETLGKETTYGENFAGKDAAGVDGVDIISGATKTTEAYKNAVKDALNAAIILGGGDVDIRTEEEILADNLAAALPEGEESFEKLFRIDIIENVDAIYAASNGAGYVFVIGEQFIGVKADGTVVGEGVENPEALSAAVALIQSTTLEEIDLTAYPTIVKSTVSAHKTSTGNYVIVTKGAGYGITGDWHVSGEYIIVKVSMTPDGKIIDCITVSQAESTGLGDACAKEEFYGQFVGKTEDNYTEIDAISKATLTTNGYKQAISRAYNVLKTLKEGE